MIARAVIVTTIAAFVTCAAVVACTAPGTGDTFQGAVPDEATFTPVAKLVGHRCGTLDCHGTTARNFRIFGSEGLRWSASDRPDPFVSSTPDEIDQTFVSLVGLEPEKMDAVVRAGGAFPESLTFVRKARGAEDHKGGAQLTQGDDADTCITSWLAGNTDQAACAHASTAP